MKKNVAFLIPQFIQGGAERVVSRLSFLLRDEYNLTVVLFDSEKIDYSCGCEIVTLKSKNMLSRLLEYRKFKKKNKIHITYSLGRKAGVIAVFSGGNDKKITSVRGYDTVNKKRGIPNSVINVVFKKICKKSDVIVCVSQLIGKDLLRLHGISPSKTFTIYNGVDVDEVVRLAIQAPDSKIVDKINGRFVFLSVGRYNHIKGYGYLLEGYKNIVTSDNCLVILGTGSPDEIAEMEENIKRLGLENNVILAGFQTNPFCYMKLADCFVLSSLNEGFPNVVIEAMACELPIVSTDCKSGPREILSEKCSFDSEITQVTKTDYGILVPDLKTINFNTSYLAEAMKTMENDKDLREYYKEQSLKRVADFNYQKLKKQHIKLFENLLK